MEVVALDIQAAMLLKDNSCQRISGIIDQKHSKVRNFWIKYDPFKGSYKLLIVIFVI